MRYSCKRSRSSEQTSGKDEESAPLSIVRAVSAVILRHMLGKRVDFAPLSVSLIGGVLMLACGAGTPPQTQLTAAQSAVRAAEVGGAEEIPKGQLHLKYARDQIAEATTLIEEKEYEKAELVLKRAEIDAHYALSVAEHAEASAEAAAVLEKIDEMMETPQ